MSPPALITIPFSHYCERARWALQICGVAFEERGNLPVLHVIASRRAGGTGTVPVLVLPGRVIGDSQEILDHAEQQAPGTLYPPQEAGQIRALERTFSEKLGPASRLIAYALMRERADLAAAFWHHGVPRWQARLIPVLFPLIRTTIVRHFAISEESLQRSIDEVGEVFDEVERRLEGHHICGERFTAADLTFASLAAPVLAPPQYGSPLPSLEQVPPRLAEVIERFRARPAGQHALVTYATER
jgi:glutathione S-transferase